ncbi:MAG: PaaI family thioesterase [Chloroflexi bacterium]|nr:PaaI family thioesterase [Chloroflexota bacterium]
MAETGVRIGGSDFLNAEPPSGFGIKMYYHEESGRTRGEIVFDAAKQGPPGCAHGGAVATVLDEAMGAVAWFNGHSALAVNLNVNLRHGVPSKRRSALPAGSRRLTGAKSMPPPSCISPTDGSPPAAPACSSASSSAA